MKHGALPTLDPYYPSSYWYVSSYAFLGTLFDFSLASPLGINVPRLLE